MVQENFTVHLAGRGALTYEEGSHKYLVNVVDGDGYSIVVEHMGDVDFGLKSLSSEERVRIAFNIKRALQRRNIAVDIQMNNRLIGTA